jgi:hypothetical protein
MIQLQQRTRVFLSVTLLICFAIPQSAHAVSPLPDGCYPNYTTAEGCNALQSLTTGLGNTGIGWYSLFGNITGSYNTAVGAGALDLNRAGNNTATGAAALLLNTTGDNNTANGVDALALNSTGIQNTANGAFALYGNTVGSGNIAIGYQAGYFLAIGSNNIAIGNIGVPAESDTIRIGDPAIHTALFLAGITQMSLAAPNQAVLVNPTTGQLGSVDISGLGGVIITDPENTAVGDQALSSNTGGSNTATGFHALMSNTSGSDNTATGANALPLNTTGEFDNAFGAFALFDNVDGFSNNAFGETAMFSNITGAANTAVGDLALEFSDASGAGSANFNTAVGAQALLSNTDGNSNNAVGFGALGGLGPTPLPNTGFSNNAMGVQAAANNQTGAANEAIGDSALLNNADGSFNTVVGDTAGQNLTSGSDNIYIGATTGGTGDESGNIRIGDPANVFSCFIAGITGVSVSGNTVVVDGNGKLGTATSSRRFKEEIKPMDKASEELYALKPVTFRYKKEIDHSGMRQLGLVAEDVEKVNPDLIVRDKEGKPYSVRYDQVNAMLLNEFLKEHHKVEELEANAVRQQKQIEALTAGLQKVSAQLEVSKRAPQTVVNNQ